MFEFDDTAGQAAKIKVIGVGGGGGNAIQNMIDNGLSGVEFIVANTDIQALNRSSADVKIQLGQHLTKGLGAGADPNIGRNAAVEDAANIQEAIMGADMVFVTAGMGGGTGTGAAPIIASLAREINALTVGVVTKPFAFEGRRRSRVGDEGLEALSCAVDSLITIPNDRLLAFATPDMSFLKAFALVDEVLLNAVRGISELITETGYINVDFADVRTIMQQTGRALMGTGYGSGPTRAEDAAQMAISSPLLEDCTIDGATGILINITGGPDLGLHEINTASCLIQDAAHEDANIIFGTVSNDSMYDEVKITVIATGFNSPAARGISEYEAHSKGMNSIIQRRREPVEVPEVIRSTGEFPAQTAAASVPARRNSGRFNCVTEEARPVTRNSGVFRAPEPEDPTMSTGRRMAKVVPNSTQTSVAEIDEEPAFLRRLRSVRGT